VEVDVGVAAGRTHDLAVVAAVDAGAECLAELDREVTVGLQQPCEAAAGIDHPVGDDGVGWTAVEAPSARATRWRDRLVVIEGRIGDHGPKHKPAAVSGYEHIAVLARPSNTGSDSGRPINQRIVIGNNSGLEASFDE